MMLSFGIASLRALLRRPPGRTDLALVVSGIVALVLLGVDVAGALSWPAEALVWASVLAAAALAPRRWVDAWAARLRRYRDL